MTPDDPRPPEEPVAPDALDTLASAIVDGEAPLPDDADAVLLERVAAFRAIRNAIAAPVPPPSDALREAAISSALVFRVISVHRLELCTTPRCCWGERRLHGSLNVIQGWPVSNSTVSILRQSCLAGIFLNSLILPCSARAS